MLSSNSCSSADIPRQILLKQMPALADMDIFVTHIYDVAKVFFVHIPSNSFLVTLVGFDAPGPLNGNDSSRRCGKEIFVQLSSVFLS
jgi:hypothetical protein